MINFKTFIWLDNFFLNSQSNSIYQAKTFCERKIVGHDVLFELNYFKEAPYSFKLRAVNTTLRSIISLSLNVCQRNLATTFFEYT